MGKHEKWKLSVDDLTVKALKRISSDSPLARVRGGERRGAYLESRPRWPSGGEGALRPE